MRKEMRAAASHQFEYILAGTFKPQNIDRVVGDLASHNYNAVLVCVRAPGIHFYPSDIGPVHRFCRDYDFLGEFIEKSHQAGLQIYSYYPVFLEGGSTDSPVDGSSSVLKRTSGGPLGGILEKHPEWACLGGKNGELRPDNWGCPSNEEYVTYAVDLIREQISRYDLDGIIWDFIRFRFPCYCMHCREKFREFTGGEDLNTRWPSPLEAEYRCHTVIEDLKRFNAAARGINPDIQIGAFAFLRRRGAITGVFQDWLTFSLYCDLILPMYYGDLPQCILYDTLREDAQLARCPLVIGLLPSLGEGVKRGREDQLCEDIETARRAGYRGFLMLSYEPLFGWERSGAYSGPYWHTPHPAGAARRITEQALCEPVEPLF